MASLVTYFQNVLGSQNDSAATEQAAKECLEEVTKKEPESYKAAEMVLEVGWNVEN